MFDPHALGFLGTGIMEGTTAAGMMSAEAIVSRWGVIKGGTVALLQSLGTKTAAASAGYAGGPIWWAICTVGAGLLEFICTPLRYSLADIHFLDAWV